MDDPVPAELQADVPMPVDGGSGSPGAADREDTEDDRTPQHGQRATENAAEQTAPLQRLLTDADTNRVVEALLQRLLSAEVQNGHHWQQLVSELQQWPPAAQQALAARITEDTEMAQRPLAMQLIADAAGPWREALLVQWLDGERTRRTAWEMLLRETAVGDLERLVPLARRSSEREQLCRRITALEGTAAARWLVELAPQQQWRPAIAQVSKELDQEGRNHLLSLLWNGSSTERAGAGFVIGTISDQDVDRQLAAMIIRGRSRQPAYLALLSRGTPAARQFLRAASKDVELAPALQSAQFSWQNFGPLTHQWLSELEETRDDDVDSAGRPSDALDLRVVAVHRSTGGCPAAC